MKVLTAAEMREVDRLTTERFGIPSLQLMEAAGTRVADACGKFVGSAATRPAKIAVLCGKGNNGGDGLVAARHLQSLGAQVKVYLFSEPAELHGDAATNLQRWTATGNSVISITDENAWQTARTEISSANVVLDAIFGTGFRGAVTGVVAKAISDVNRHSSNATAVWPALILAVDTPAVGILEVADIGSPALLIEEIGKGSLRWAEPHEFAGLPLVRTVDSYKGLYGHALIVAGSLGKSGAAVMAGYAALRAGAGLATVATPDVVLPLVASAHPELMTEPLLATSDGTAAIQNLTQQRFQRIAEGKSVLALGPGLGLHSETQDFIRKVVLQTGLPVVLDADGLSAFAEKADELNRRKAKFLAITPHPGEMARLLNSSTTSVQEDRVKTAQEAARRWN